jgi:hypothetical protein
MDNKTLLLMKSEFETHMARFHKDEPTFTAVVKELMGRQYWNYTTFCEKTLLDKSVYSRIVNQKEKIALSKPYLRYAWGLVRIKVPLIDC